jgi:hypothetical protein
MPHHDVRLKKTEKNAILHLIDTAGLNPLDFVWTEDESNEDDESGAVYFTISVLTHRPTGYLCRFGGIGMEISPGPDKRVEAVEHLDSWETKSRVVQVWLEELREEVAAPDLWAIIGQEKALSTAAASTRLDNRSFTAAEQNSPAVAQQRRPGKSNRRRPPEGSGALRCATPGFRQGWKAPVADY